MDTLTPAQRRQCMQRIRSKGSVAELAVRRALHAAGLRFRLHRNDLPGKPDLVFPKHRTVLFVHGCFWHGHEVCYDGHTPKTNTGYWGPKLERNKQRDADNTRRLQESGWRVIVVWECETRDTERLTRRILDALEAGPCA